MVGPLRFRSMPACQQAACSCTLPAAVNGPASGAKVDRYIVQLCPATGKNAAVRTAACPNPIVIQCECLPACLGECSASAAAGAAHSTRPTLQDWIAPAGSWFPALQTRTLPAGFSIKCQAGGLTPGMQYVVTATAVSGGVSSPAANALLLTMPAAGAPSLVSAVDTSSTTGSATASPPAGVVYNRVGRLRLLVGLLMRCCCGCSGHGVLWRAVHGCTRSLARCCHCRSTCSPSSR